MVSLDPPLDILKVLARRVIDEQLFSATNVIRGPDPEEGDRETTKSGYIDYIGISPAAQLEILKVINLNRAAVFDEAVFTLIFFF